MIDVSNFSLKKESAPTKAGTRWKARYPKKLPEYAKAYGRGVDTIKAWIHRGKRSGYLPPLEHPDQFPTWYSEHIGAVPDDLLALCVPNAAQQRQANGARPIGLDEAVVEVRKILAREIETLNQSVISDTRRSVLLRNIQNTSDSLCRLERTSSDIRKAGRDALPWGVFAAGINEILHTLIEIRRGFPRKLFVELEKEFCLHHHRLLRAIKEPVLKAAKKACDDDIHILVHCPELRPVIEKMQQRFEELEAAAAQAYRDGKTPIPMTFEPVTTDQV